MWKTKPGYIWVETYEKSQQMAGVHADVPTIVTGHWRRRNPRKMTKLPPHLAFLSKQLGQGKTLSGKRLLNKDRRALGKLIGATHFRGGQGKIHKV